MKTTHDLLQVRGLSVFSKNAGQTLVHEVSFSLAAGRTLGIVGASGSGKTLTAMAIAGLLPPNTAARGTVTLAGKVLSVDDPSAARPLRIASIGVVFQNPTSALNPRLTVGAQLAEALSPGLRREKAASASACLGLLEDVGIVDPLRKLAAYPHELSGGQAQRVVIAMALARQPQLLIADEPTTALDVTIQAQILDLIAALQQRHAFAVLLVTHDMDVVKDRADDVLVLSHGRVAAHGPVHTLATHAAGPESDPRMRPPAPQFPQAPAAQRNVNAAPFVAVRMLVKTFGRATQALKGVTLGIRAGQTVGIVGESGSGKTTLARILAGLAHQDAGEVTIDGRLRPPGQRSSQVQYVFQDAYTSLDPRMPAIESVAEPFLAQRQRRATALAAAAALLREVGLDEALWWRRPIHLSGGQRQRVGISRALALNPRLLIADEPVAALDATARDRVLQLFSHLQATRGMAQLIISHDLAVIARLCSDVVVMRQGEIVESGATADVLAAPRHAYTRELLAAIPGRRPRHEPTHPISVQPLTSTPT